MAKVYICEKKRIPRENLMVLNEPFYNQNPEPYEVGMLMDVPWYEVAIGEKHGRKLVVDVSTLEGEYAAYRAGLSEHEHMWEKYDVIPLQRIAHALKRFSESDGFYHA
jgi:hypothetical protein